MSGVERVMVGLRIPADLAERMRADAAYRGQALNVWFVRAVQAAVERGEAESREAAQNLMAEYLANQRSTKGLNTAARKAKRRASA